MGGLRCGRGSRTLEELVARLRLGPPAAAVEEAEVAWEEFRGEFDGFRIAWS
jgi:acylphosphatase